MGQMSWRVTDEVLERVRRQAHAQGQSLNEWVTLVMQAASDPAYATTDAERIRERLAAAGILHVPTPVTRKAHSRKAVSKARAEAGEGRSLADIVVTDRR
jgi:hypothetical protein